MYSRWYSVCVLLLWLTSMTWLVTKKVLPPLLKGQPPNYRTIVAAQRGAPPVGWRVVFNSRPLGWAKSTISSAAANEWTEIHSRVHFDELPLAEMADGWARALYQLIDRPLAKSQMDIQSAVTIDALGRLLNFDSTVRLDRIEKLVRVRGVVDGAEMSVVVAAGDFTYKADIGLPPDALLADAFSPQTELPGLRAGQTWTVPCYNPLRPREPMEILQATVERSDSIAWDGHNEDVWLVVYRGDPGSALGSDQALRGRLWVRPDGTVLKQQAILFNCSIVFVRLPDAEAAALADTIDRPADH